MTDSEGAPIYGGVTDPAVTAARLGLLTIKLGPAAKPRTPKGDQ